MKCGYRIVLLLAFTGPLLQLAPPAMAGDAASLSSAQIALQSKDLPTGFKQVQNGYLKTDQLAKSFHTTTALMKRSGLVTTYESAFTQPKAPVGITIADVIDHFNSLDAAQLSYRRLSQLGTTAFRPYHPHNVPQLGLGAEAGGITYNWRAKNIALTTVSLLLRQGTYVAIVVVTGPSYAVKASSAVHLAQIVEQRMKRAG